MTGAIADSINFAVEQLRTPWWRRSTTPRCRSRPARRETQATAMHLAGSGGTPGAGKSTRLRPHQRNRGEHQPGVAQPAESAEVAQRSVQIATNGAGVVRQTIAGMDSIRDQIRKPPSASSDWAKARRKSADRELINDISEQTNIPGAERGDPAASAGEAGRGFAVVADEVQRLAERSSSATKRIESLVTIQADTNEAVSSMEQTTRSGRGCGARRGTRVPRWARSKGVGGPVRVDSGASPPRRSSSPPRRPASPRP